MIDLFPPNGIDQTIHVAIWLGLLLSLLLTETLGWTFSGLVVPGYLASLFVLEPASAMAVVLEAVLTFVVARTISEVASRSGAWSKFFGRERFLLVIFVSIAVRQISELWLLPEIARVIDARFETTLRLSHTLSSIGLVLVPLTANAFWKIGLRRGMFQVAVPTAITYAVIAYVLLPFTNLSFSRLELTYENVALDFLSSPKAYILLIAGAFLGSRYNLRYGWDYAGILIPALLAIAWIAPLRILTTLIEALLLVLVVRILVRLPVLRAWNLEGPRKVALVFTVSFALKWTLGWFVGPTVHGLKVVELFGFGYLLSSLIAVKILQKDAISRIAVPSIAVGVAGWIAGSFIGFGLDKIAPAPPPATASPTVLVAAAPEPPTTTLLRSTMGVLALGHARSRLPEAEIVVTPAQRDQYAAMWHAIAQWLARPSEGARHDVLARATGLGLVLVPVDDGFALYRRDERLDAPLAWDTAMLVPGAPGPVIVVPRPASEAPSAEVAAVLCARVRCRAVIVAGREGGRGATARAAFRGVPTFEVRTDAKVKAAVFHVAEEAPDIDVAALWPKETGGTDLELSWERPPAGSGGVLRANPDAYWAVLAERAQAIAPVAKTIDAWFAEWAGSTPAHPARDPQQPSQTELRFLDVALGTPAITGRSLRGVRTLAALVGYDVVQLADGTWLIAETAWPRNRGWGVLAGRAKSAPVTIEIPRPRREAGTLRLGVEAFRRTNASVLVVADPDVVADRGDADPVSPWNLATPLHAFHAAAFHARRGAPGAAVLQIRGYGATQPIHDPVVVTAWRPILAKEHVPAPLQKLVDGLAFMGPARFHDGSRELLDLAGTGNPQLEHCERYEAMPCALVWVSEAVRTEFREVDRDRELATLRGAGVEIIAASPVEALTRDLEPSRLPPAASARFDEIAKILEGYAADGNVQRLRLLEGKVHLRGGYSEEVGRAYLQFDVVDGAHVARGLVLVPAGKLRAEIPPGEGLARRIDAVLAHRPLSIRIAGVVK